MTMPFFNLGSPSKASSPKASKGEKEERRTHIEVCARIRPLMVGGGPSQSSHSGFFDKPGSSATEASRTPSIPTPSSNRRSIFGYTSKNKSSSESLSDESSCVLAWDVHEGDTAVQSPDSHPVAGRTHRYTLDHVYDPTINTRHIYSQSVQPLVHAAMEGYHTSILAYGQTSTGKTYTMTGTTASPGLVPLAIRDCFRYVESSNGDAREYLLRISYLEVYNEQIRDLLVPSTSTTLPIRMFDSSSGGLVIRGLREEVVTTPEQVFGILRNGEARRQFGATSLNQKSSRSHVMVRLTIESRAVANTNTTSTPSVRQEQFTGKDGVRVSTLCLVDLAGSESVRLTKSLERRQEGHYINKSLMTLGQVVYALSENHSKRNYKQHIPYRDSKLTRLLQPSLSGNAQVVILCCISPLVSHVEESHNTFKFGIRAKKIPQRAEIQILQTDNDKTLLQAYRKEIEDLKKQLEEARSEKAQQQEVSGEIKELVDAIATLETLILKSSAAGRRFETPNKNAATDDDEFQLHRNSNDEDEELLDNLLEDGGLSSDSPTTSTPKSSSTATPIRDPNLALTAELHRIRGLVVSVVRKRGSPSSSSSEVQHLKARLQQQEVATSLRKADSYFLQSQLDEKNQLLEEVSNVLKAVEERQLELEEENARLRRELDALRGSAQ